MEETRRCASFSFVDQGTALEFQWISCAFRRILIDQKDALQRVASWMKAGASCGH
jgi:hypothetical protein